MSELEKVPAQNAGGQDTGGAVEKAGAVLTDAVTYAIVVAEMAAAGARLAGLSEQVRSTYRYVERCARSVVRLADRMAALNVDVDTVAEHREAAQVMRSVLAAAEEMAAGMDDLSTLFSHTASAHRADYGSVVDAANNMSVPMAQAEFYSNR